jgi:hypothetical protein
MHIADSYFINFADAGPRQRPDGSLIYDFGRRIGDDIMTAFGVSIMKSSSRSSLPSSGSMGRLLRILTGRPDTVSITGRIPYERDVWLDGIQVMAARSRAGEPEGLYLAIKGGHNAESHNHNDVGSFIVYVDGRPAIVDPGPGEYTTKYFSSERYTVSAVQSAYHNLPTVNGYMQSNGREFCARKVSYEAEEPHARISMDIGSVYCTEAGIVAWQRTMLLARDKKIELSETFELARRDGELMLSLMTPCTVDLSVPGSIKLTEKEAEKPFELMIEYPSDKLTARQETVEMGGNRMYRIWGGSLTRITLVAPADSPLRDAWKIIFHQ